MTEGTHVVQRSYLDLRSFSVVNTYADREDAIFWARRGANTHPAYEYEVVAPDGQIVWRG